jgi:site-specific recombinase XerD
MEKLNNTDITIKKSIEMFLENVSLSRSENTSKTYHNGMNVFCEMLEENEILTGSPVSEISEELTGKYAKYLKYYSAATENLYITVYKNYLEFLLAENLVSLNLQQVKQLIIQRIRKPGIRLPQFPQADIEKVLIYAAELPVNNYETETDRLINLRDCAFLLTLADTGLRIHEACNLRRGDIDWFKKKAIIIGKGNKQAVIRFSERSIMAMRNYLSERSHLDGSTTKQLAALPVFSRHDKGAGKNILPITTKTGRIIVSERVSECLGKQAVGTITPHSFRHYFVTTVLQETGNLKIAQEFARHTNIAVTQRYTHLANDELDDAYHKIFDKDKSN